MKQFIKSIIFTFVVLSLTTQWSCSDDFLDTEPVTSIPANEAFSTPGKLLAHVNNLYGQLQAATLYGGRYIVFNEQRADEFGQNDGNAATGSAIWNQNVGSTSEYINNVWSVAYTAINAANILIDKLNMTTVVTPDVAKTYMAEAKFVRALAYFCLVQTYAKPYNLDKTALGVPLRLTPITTSGNNDLARNPVQKVYAQILKDLNEAELDLPNHYTTSLLNTSRAKKCTAIALKTRVLLHQNDYKNLVVEAKKIVGLDFQYSTGTLTHKLEANYATIYSGSYTGPEAIFSMPFANTTTETPPTQSALAFNYVTQPILFLTAAGVVSNPLFSDPSDARSSLIGKNAANQKILRKFAITTAPFRDYVPVIRYAEVILNYAEAAAYENDLELAKSLLKAVRNRSNPSFAFTAEDLSTQTKIIENIMIERRVELVGEGFRLGDLQRKVEALPSKVGAIGTAPLVLSSAKNYIWPIPSGEMSTNKLMVQN
jgi:starch-binding outer membrane protein, SusD/RagB family